MHKVLPPLLALTALSLGAVAVLSVVWTDEAPAPVVESVAQADRPAASASGEAAVMAVQAHLHRLGAGTLTGIVVNPLDEAGATAVCGRLGGPGGADVVARVIPAAGVLMVPETRQADRDTAAPLGMVVMEDGPGLWRGGAPGLPWQRYCGTTRAAAPNLAAPPEPPRVGAVVRTSLEEAPAVPGADLAADRVLEPEAAGAGSVTVLSPVRVRSAPSGQSDILWVAERGRAFTVHGHAPGGWVQIGDGTAPAGWAHSSLLDSAM